MIRRRQLHHVFDLFRCDTWTNIVEREGFAAEKNLVLRECYLTLQQLAELPQGLLVEKVKLLEKVLLRHLLGQQTFDSCLDEHESQDSSRTMSIPLNVCKLCKVNKYRCEICNGKAGP